MVTRPYTGIRKESDMIESATGVMFQEKDATDKVNH